MLTIRRVTGWSRVLVLGGVGSDRTVQSCGVRIIIMAPFPYP